MAEHGDTAILSPTSLHSLERKASSSVMDDSDKENVCPCPCPLLALSRLPPYLYAVWISQRHHSPGQHDAVTQPGATYPSHDRPRGAPSNLMAPPIA